MSTQPALPWIADAFIFMLDSGQDNAVNDVSVHMCLQMTEKLWTSTGIWMTFAGSPSTGNGNKLTKF